MKMKMTKKRGVIAALLVAILLCGCGNSTEKRTQTGPKTNEKEVKKQEYIEQSVEVGGDEKEGEGMLLDSQTVWQYGDCLMYQREDGLPYVVQIKEDGIMREACSWEKNWEKKFKKKYMSIGNWQKLNDKIYYVIAYENSMDPEKVRNDREKYLDDYYVVHQYLLRLNYETGEIQDIPLPQHTMKEYYKKQGEPLPADENGKQIVLCDIKVLPDGTFLMADMEKHPAICDGVTGEKLIELDLNVKGDVGVYTAVGDGFVAAVTEDYEASEYTLHLYDVKTGVEEYTIPLDFQFNRKTEDIAYANFALGASGDHVFYVYDKCIYKMDYGDEKLEKVLDADDGGMYYLPDEDYTYESICMGKQEDFYVRMYKESDDYEGLVCHYIKKGTNKNEE